MSGGEEPPAYYSDYTLIKELYRCKPSDLDNENHFILSAHAAFHNLQAEKAEIDRKRASQRSKHGK